MADWDKVLDLGNGLPDRESRADAVAGLCDALRSPDPALRDEHDLPCWPAGSRGWTSRSATPWVTSWPHGLAMRKSRPGRSRRSSSRRSSRMASTTLAAFADWYPAETDLRGYNPELGWLHAVAHGADLLGAFGQHPGVDRRRCSAWPLRACWRLRVMCSRIRRTSGSDSPSARLSPAASCPRRRQCGGWSPSPPSLARAGPARFLPLSPIRCGLSAWFT
jgi:hypothetical protein